MKIRPKKHRVCSNVSCYLPTESESSSIWRSSMEEIGLFLTSSTRAAGRGSPWNTQPTYKTKRNACTLDRFKGYKRKHWCFFSASTDLKKKRQLFEDFPQCVHSAWSNTGKYQGPCRLRWHDFISGIQIWNNSSIPSVKLLSRENPLLMPL